MIEASKVKAEDRRTISIHRDTKKALNGVGVHGETYDDIIKRLVAEHLGNGRKN